MTTRKNKMIPTYENKLIKDHKRLIKSIKTTDDVWEKLLKNSTDIHASHEFYKISHLFTSTKETENQVEITVSSLNRFNGVSSKVSLWINKNK
jgi:hypothetical protein